MIVFGYGISLDVDQLPFAVLDSDGTPASRDYVDSFRGSYYFVENSPLANYSELDRRLRNGELRLALELPTGFQKDLQRGRQPEVNVFIDAAQPFRAETARGTSRASMISTRPGCATRRDFRRLPSQLKLKHVRFITKPSRASMRWCPATSCSF